MKKFKRIITLALASILSLNAIPVYAGIDNNGTGGGTNTALSTRDWIGRYHAFQENNGIRLYLADKSGYAVTNIVDFVNYIPENIDSLGSEKAQWYKEYENMTGKREAKKKILYLGGIKTDTIFTQVPQDVPEKLKEVFTEGGGVYWIPKEGEADTSTKRQWKPQKMYTYHALEDKINGWVNQKFKDNTSHIAPKDGTYSYIDSLTGETVTVPHKIQGPVQLSADGKGNEGTGDILMKQMMTPIGKNEHGGDIYQVTALLNIELPKSSPDGTRFIGEAEPLFEFYNKDLKTQFEKEMASGLTYGEAMVKVAQDNSLYVGVEPIGWFVNEVVNAYAESGKNGTDMNAYWCTPKIVYGTVTLASMYTYQQLMTEMKREGKGLVERLTISSQVSQGWQWSLAYTSYRLNRKDADLKLDTFEDIGKDPNLIGVAEDPYHLNLQFWVENSNTLGYGIMLFGLTPQTTVRTSTWDKSSYPADNYKPEKAPVPADKSEGADFEKAGKDHKFNIIKFYGERNSSNDVTYTENHIRENTVHNITINDELSYKVEDWFTSSEYKEPASNTDSYDDWKLTVKKGDKEGNQAGQVTIPADSKDTTLYLKLIKGEETAPPLEDGTKSNIILHEDEISYPYSMGSIKTSLDELWHTFPDKSYSGGSNHNGSDDEDDWTCSWSRELDDESYSMELKNNFNYGATNFIGSQGVFTGSEGGKVSTGNSEVGANLSGFDTEHLIPDWLFTLYRDKSKDKVTLYPDKNSADVVNNLSLIGIDGVSYIPSNRVAKENGGSFKDTFSIKYVYETLDKTLSWDSTGCGSHGDSDSYDGAEHTYIDTFNSSYSTGENVLTKYYLGKANKGEVLADSSASPFVYDGKTYKLFLSTKMQNHTIKFYPMVKMTYQTQSVGETAVYVTSTNESLMSVPTRIDVGVYKDSAKAGLYLDSTQWSTHAKTQKFLTSSEIKDKNSVLPGGAIYNLKTSNSVSPSASDNWVGIHSYQICLADNDLSKLSENNGIVGETQAKQRISEFLSQAEHVLSKYQIVQWVSKGIQKDAASFKSASPVLVSGVGQVSKFGDNTLDRSGKYYLKVDGNGADRADLDIVDKTQNQIVWTISSDTDGNVTVKNDKGLLVTAAKTQGTGVLTANSEIKLLDDKTKVVTNFISSLDRNKGANRESSKWYNEAFEEIKVVEDYTAFKLGFGGGQEARGSVLDTKLTGKLTERRDLYNFEADSLSEKARTSQFKTSARSTDTSANGKAAGYIGTIDGIDVMIPNIENLMVSKLFYIPNANVTDLN